MDEHEGLDGLWDVMFVGSDIYHRVEVDFIMVNGDGQHLYIVDKSGSIWNWSTIIKMKRPD